MAMIVIDAGVTGTGEALTVAARVGNETAVKLLLQRWEQGTVDGAAYVNIRGRVGGTPLLCAVDACRCSPGVVRLLVDARADTISVVRVTNSPVGGVASDETPLNITNRSLRAKKVGGKDPTEEQLHGQEGIPRLLVRVEAVHCGLVVVAQRC